MPRGDVEATKKRQELQAFIDARKLKVARWASRAEIAEGTVRNFLAGRSNTLTQATVDALAKAEGVTPADIFPSSYQQNSSEKDRTAHGPRKLVVQTTRAALGLEDMGAPYLSEQRDLPIRGYAKGGEGGFFYQGEAMGFTYRPSTLVGVEDAYSFEVFDTSMEPAMMHGHLQWVHPRKQIQPGDNVVLELDNGETLVKRLVRRTTKEVTLMQWNPRKEISIPAARIKFMHLVIGGLYVRVG